MQEAVGTTISQHSALRQNSIFNILSRRQEPLLNICYVTSLLISSSVTVRSVKKKFMFSAASARSFLSRMGFGYHLQKCGTQVGTEIMEERMEQQICLQAINLPHSTISVPTTKGNKGVEENKLPEILALVLEFVSPTHYICTAIIVDEPMDFGFEATGMIPELDPVLQDEFDKFLNRI